MDAELPAAGSRRARSSPRSDRCRPARAASRASRVRPRAGDADDRPDDLVAVSEDGRRHVDPVAETRFRGPAAAVDLRLDVLDQDPSGRPIGRGHGKQRAGTVKAEPLLRRIVLHPTSLPEGRLGPGAYAFVDWLAAAGAGWWQVLPLNPPDEHGSPYSSPSAFATWGGLLAEPEAPSRRPRRRRSAGTRLLDRRLGAYAGGDAWTSRCDSSGSGWRCAATRADRGVRMIGDVPIYVAEGSCDHLAHAELFLAGVVAGAPPDAARRRWPDWGNPLYDWGALARSGYRWWIERLRRVFSSSTPSGSTTSAASPVSGRSRRRPARRAPGEWCPAREQSRFAPPSGSSARCRWLPRISA